MSQAVVNARKRQRDHDDMAAQAARHVKPQKRRTTSQGRDRADSRTRSQTKGYKRDAFPDLMESAAFVALIENTINCADGLPQAYPDANNASTHVVHHRLVADYTATADGTDFTFVMPMDPQRALLSYVEGTVGTSLLTGGVGALINGLDGTGASYWNSVNGRNGSFGGMPNSTNALPIVSMQGAGGEPVFQFSNPAGREFNTLNASGALDLNTTGVNTNYSVSLQYAVQGDASGATNTLQVQVSTDGSTNWSTIGTVSAAEGTLLNVTTSSSTLRYVRVLFSTSVAYSSARRSMSYGECQINPGSAIFGAGFVDTPVNSVDVLVAGTRGWRPIGGNCLVTNMASSLKNGGQIASAQISSQSSLSIDGFPDYNKIASLPIAYNGKVKNGTFVFWTPEDSTQMAFRPWGEDTGVKLPYLVATGSLAEAGGTIRVQVDMIIEYLTESEAFCPYPSRTSVWEIEARAEIMSQISCHGCANDFHKTFQDGVRKAAALWKKARPWLAGAAKVAAAVGPLLLAI